MANTAVEPTLIPREAVAALEAKGYRVFVATERSLELGNGAQILQLIKLDDGEYRASRIPMAEGKASGNPEAKVLPELGEALKWLEATA